MRQHGLFRGAVVAVLLTASLLTPIGPSNAQPDSSATQPSFGDFPIGFWCGPPPPFITVDRFRQIRDAGFTFAMPHCNGSWDVATNRRVLDAAQAAGIKAVIFDERMPTTTAGDGRARLDAIINDYRAHPALGGYFIKDEPCAALFTGLGSVVAYLRAQDPTRLAYINIYPNYASSAQLSCVEQSTMSYEQYVQSYINTVRPEVVSYDHYFPFQGDERPNGFFGNLSTIRQHAFASSLPFWNIGLSTSHAVPNGADYRRPTEAEELWQALQTLAYGGHGFLFYTYWQPDHPTVNHRPAIIDRAGNPTAQYAEIQRVNAKTRAIGWHLLTARWRMTFQNGTRTQGGQARPAGAPVYLLTRAPITVGVFDSPNYVYMLLTNRDRQATSTTRALLSHGSTAPERLDPASGTWSPVGREVDLSLPAGDGVLFRVRNPVPAGPSVAAVYHVTGDWDGNGADGPGIVIDDGARMFWHLKNAANFGPADYVFEYGGTGDVPVVGDWDGNGADGPGITRDVNNLMWWHLKNVANFGPAERIFHYGEVGDIPVVGDWDGVGGDGPGYVRVEGPQVFWNLRRPPAPGDPEYHFGYGGPGDVPVVGDWDGVGGDGPGITRQSGGRMFWHLRRPSASGPADYIFEFGGGTGDWPVTGEWDGVGGDGPGITRQSSARLFWHLRNPPSNGPTDYVFEYGFSF